ncbi:MAG: histidine kinase [Saprospiraceae bacterium]|nr:histidine kinase [Saprospiraceae bacterium]
MRNKLLLAFGLNAFFYPVLLYVNLDENSRAWSAIFGELFPILFSEYVAGALVIFGWLYVAEWQHARFERWFGEEIISRGEFLPNLAAILAFAAANLAINYLSIRGVYWMQIYLLGRADQAIVADTEYSRMSMRFTYANYVIMSLFVYYLLTNRRIQQRAREVALRAERARKEQVEGQYAQLRHRVNPHFLFNSLSTLSSLVQVDGERSEQFIDRLSKAYRYMLENRDRQTVALKAELEFLQAYAFLLRTRFGNKFQLDINLHPSVVERGQLVPLSLQLVLDRALRHNRMSAQAPLSVSIRSENDAILIQNNRQPRLEPDLSIGDSDWTVFENCYALLDNGNRRVREWADDKTWTVSIPVMSDEY